MSTTENIFEYVNLINKRSKVAFKIIASSKCKDRNLAILNTSKIIKDNINKILQITLIFV